MGDLGFGRGFGPDRDLKSAVHLFDGGKTLMRIICQCSVQHLSQFFGHVYVKILRLHGMFRAPGGVGLKCI
jgi:hypothetical protein